MPRMFTPRLIACDVDGTLLPEGHTALMPETVSLIGRLLDAGIVFAPASGRQLPNLQRVFAQFIDRIPMIAENGTIAVLNGETVFRATMEQELGREIIRTIQQKPHYEALVSGASISYIQPKDPSFISFMSKDIRYECKRVEDLLNIPEPYSKITAYHPAVAEEADYWRGRFGERCTVAISGLTWLDFMPAGISKASGLAAVCEHLGIAPADCLAIGDNDNDVEMFDLAGHAIAMETGSAAAHDHAQETTPGPNAVFRRILESL
jgi:Cof subfamily protein (haloacid dehalogenase superfamily)